MGAHAVVEAVGPYPALWQNLSPAIRDEIASHYQMSPDEWAWIAGLGARTLLVRTETDDQMVTHCPWRDSLRASLHMGADKGGQRAGRWASENALQYVSYDQHAIPPMRSPDRRGSWAADGLTRADGGEGRANRHWA